MSNKKHVLSLVYFYTLAWYHGMNKSQLIQGIRVVCEDIYDEISSFYYNHTNIVTYRQNEL